MPNASAERLGVEAGDEEAADPLDQVGDRVEVAIVRNQLLLDQVPGQRHRGEEEEDEEDREEALHRLAGADPQRRRRCRCSRTRTRSNSERSDQHRDARRSRPRTRPRRRGRRRCSAAAWTNPSAIAPPSVPASSAAPPSGVSASRLRKPVSMSVARSVPELSRAKIAPWMNGTASAKLEVGVGREAGDVRGRVEPRRVHREQEQREDHRRDDRGRLADRAQEGPSCDLGDLSRRAGPHAGTASCSPVATSAALARALELAPGLGEEDVVEGGRVQLQVGQVDALGVELADDRLEAVMAGREPDRDGLPAGVELPAPGAEAAHHLDQPRAVGRIGRGRLDRGLADLGLERGGGALGDDLAAVDDPDAIGEAVGLLEVLGGEEDGHALVVREPLDLLPERASGSAGRARWWARRGRGSAGDARAPGRGRGAASCRPSSRRRGDPPPRPARRARSARRRGGGAPPSARRGGWSEAACARAPSGADRAPPPAAPPRSPRAPGPPARRRRTRPPWPVHRLAAAGSSASAPWSTSPPRWGRGTRRSRRSRRAGRCRRPRAALS